MTGSKEKVLAHSRLSLLICRGIAARDRSSQTADCGRGSRGKGWGDRRPHALKRQMPRLWTPHSPSVIEKPAFSVPQFALNELLQRASFVLPRLSGPIELAAPAGRMIVHQINV